MLEDWENKKKNFRKKIWEGADFIWHFALGGTVISPAGKTP